MFRGCSTLGQTSGSERLPERLAPSACDEFRGRPRRLLLGRVTYEGFAKAWLGRADEVGFADKTNILQAANEGLE